MNSISLDGEWQLYSFEEGSRRVGHPDELPALGIGAVPAVVPGNVELDLHRAGLIADPFYADTIRRLRDLERREWWYVRSFAGPNAQPGVRWMLRFAGLEPPATVWLNGSELGSAHNALIPHPFDVTDALRYGQRNELAVRVGSAVLAARRHHYDVASMSWEGREEGLFVRKAPHVWGWDIMPRAVSAGIWRSVTLEQEPATAIEQLYVWTDSVGGGGAILGVRFQFRTTLGELAPGTVLRLQGALPGGAHEFVHQQPVEFVAGGFRFAVPGAHLWWPKGYEDLAGGPAGGPALYTLRTELLHDGVVLASRMDRIGIRKVDILRSERAGPALAAAAALEHSGRWDTPADPAGRFQIVVNGVPVMVKGSNWVPLDAYHSRDAGRLDQALALFNDLGCNMVRCWGGNVYEDEAFFERCDESGVMVWQDFAFACCRYPQTEDFLAEVRHEAETVVRRIRNHPSLVIWCGDNEVDQAYVSDGLSPECNRLTREVLPQIVHRCDPFRAFIPSSPHVSPAALADPEPVRATPEQHLWGPRGYYKSPYYTAHRAAFIGEIGYHGCPNVSSIRRFISPERLWPWQDNDEWQAHAVYHWLHQAVDRDRIALMVNQVRELFGTVPDRLEEFALASQIVQAEAKKFFIEATRLRKWRTSGILWWNVIDGWPQFSDAVVDYYGSKKLAYHYIRRVQQPVCVMVGEPGPGKYLPVVIGNDSRMDAAVRFRISELDGTTLVEGQATVPANQNWQVAKVRAFAGEQRLLLLEWESDGRRLGNHYLAGMPPFSFSQYRNWLSAIAALSRPFDADGVAQ